MSVYPANKADQDLRHHEFNLSNQVRKLLGSIVWRRNKIAHESDRDHDNNDEKRPINAAKAMEAVETLEMIAEAILVAIDEVPS